MTKSTLFDNVMMQQWFPDIVFRFGIRHLIHRKWKDEQRLLSKRQDDMATFLATGPLATHTSESQHQHYCVPTSFFQHVLGPHLKYSSAFWDQHTHSLADAEYKMLELSCERAQLQNGQRILELGCGWGSLTLFMARKYPQSPITALSHSATQRSHIEAVCQREGLDNVTVITADINAFQCTDTFDRIVSIEMFEHLSNYKTLFRLLRSWLAPNGKVFVHVFGHPSFCYPFTNSSSTDWMARHFFTGGIMPAKDTFSQFCSPLQIEQQWDVNGTHYQKTCNAWLANLHSHKKTILDIFAESQLPSPTRSFVAWRIFFMACAELFGYQNGNQWQVFHFRFSH